MCRPERPAHAGSGGRGQPRIGGKVPGNAYQEQSAGTSLPCVKCGQPDDNAYYARLRGFSWKLIENATGHKATALLLNEPACRPTVCGEPKGDTERAIRGKALLFAQRVHAASAATLRRSGGTS
jgi:hypothetical protein